jgi:hypothetical protein
MKNVYRLAEIEQRILAADAPLPGATDRSDASTSCPSITYMLLLSIRVANL